jgi:hypothetical protein
MDSGTDHLVRCGQLMLLTRADLLQMRLAFNPVPILPGPEPVG